MVGGATLSRKRRSSWRVGVREMERIGCIQLNETGCERNSPFPFFPCDPSILRTATYFHRESDVILESALSPRGIAALRVVYSVHEEVGPRRERWENDIDRGTLRRSGVKGEKEEESRTIYHRARNRARIFAVG